MSGIPETARQEVQARAQWRCERCHTTDPGVFGWEIHHRKLKQMGGRKHDPLIHAVTNLAFLCGNCHTWIHSNVGQARATGWIVPQHRSPAMIPFYPLGADYNDLCYCGHAITFRDGACWAHWNETMQTEHRAAADWSDTE